MSTNDKLMVGNGQYLDLALANRHGLITGATGTGKTVTLQGLAESFCQAGVSVFAADIKGDLSGIAADDRFPVVLWDIFGDQGHPIRATIARSRSGPPQPYAGLEPDSGGRA